MQTKLPGGDHLVLKEPRGTVSGEKEQSSPPADAKHSRVGLRPRTKQPMPSWGPQAPPRSVCTPAAQAMHPFPRWGGAVSIRRHQEPGVKSLGIFRDLGHPIMN